MTAKDYPKPLLSHAHHDAYVKFMEIVDHVSSSPASQFLLALEKENGGRESGGEAAVTSFLYRLSQNSHMEMKQGEIKVLESLGMLTRKRIHSRRSANTIILGGLGMLAMGIGGIMVADKQKNQGPQGMDKALDTMLRVVIAEGAALFTTLGIAAVFSHLAHREQEKTVEQTLEGINDFLTALRQCENTISR